LPLQACGSVDDGVLDPELEVSKTARRSIQRSSDWTLDKVEGA